MPFFFPFILWYRVHMYSTWRPLNTATYRNETQLLENVMQVGVITLRNRNGEHSLAGRMQHAACRAERHTRLGKVYPRHTG